MSSKFKSASNNWTEFRKLPDLIEVDFHLSEKGGVHDYWQSMDDVYRIAIKAIQTAQKDGKQYVLFRHGSSTSRIGKTTSRSQVRKAMRNTEATPFIIRSKCIQHSTVFVACIRPIIRQSADYSDTPAD